MNLEADGVDLHRRALEEPFAAPAALGLGGVPGFGDAVGGGAVGTDDLDHGDQAFSFLAPIRSRAHFS